METVDGVRKGVEWPWEQIPMDISLVVCYAVVIPILIQKAPHKSYFQGPRLHNIMLGYNAVLSIFSAVCFVTIAAAMYRGTLYSEDCSIFYSDPDVQWVSKIFHWSKYVEFVDTIFLIMNGRNVMWLHYIHHIGAPVNLALGRASGNESIWIFIFLNSFIHTCMYAYYALSLGNKRTKGIAGKYKKHLTTMQITQFVGGFVFLYSYKNIKCFGDNIGLMTTFVYTWLYVGVVLAFFIVFFVTKYLDTSNKFCKDETTKRDPFADAKVKRDANGNVKIKI
jgi:hypothetical protein